MLRSLVSRTAVSSIRRPLIQPPVLSSIRSFHASAPNAGKDDEDIVVGEGVIDKYKLYEPIRYVPLTVGFFSSLSAAGLYHFNEETQLLGIFCLFVGTVYAKGGDAVGAFLDQQTSAILTEQNDIERQTIEVLKSSKEIQQEGLQNYDQIIAVYEDFLKVCADLNECHPRILETRVHKQVEDLMNVYVSQENKLAMETERLVIDSAATAVRASFIADPKLQASALDHAFAQLSATAGGAEASSKKDVVADLFGEFFNKFREEAWKDRVANPVVHVSAKVQDDCESVRKQLVSALGDVENADALFEKVGDKFDLVGQGMEGAIATVDLSTDARFLTASSDNQKFMPKKDFDAWLAESNKASA